MKTLQQLMDTLPQTGTVEWIGVRPARREAIRVLDEVFADSEAGLRGDRYSKTNGDRQVTLIQAEHLEAVASMLGIGDVDPSLVRRNIVVRHINLLALKDGRFRVGGAVLEHTGACHPCSWMEQALGDGGYNAMRGHGGITARIVTSGDIRIGDEVAKARGP